MTLSATPLIPRDGKIEILDGAALILALAYEDGDWQASGIMEDQKQVKGYMSRGRFYSVRKTDDQEIEGSFSCHLTGLTGDGVTAQPLDPIRKKGLWAAATSTLAATAGDAHLLTVRWTGERTNLGATADSVCTLKYCHISADLSEGDPGKLSFKLTCFPLSTDYLTIT